MKKKNGKRSSLLILVLLLLVGLSSVYVASTYAKYTETLDEKTGTANIAHWEFGKENNSGKVTFALERTYNANTLVADKIAPGTAGDFTIKLKNANTETGVHYKLGILFEEIDDEYLSSGLKFYKDQSKTTEITASTFIEGDLNAADATETPIKIYWAWEYEATGDKNAVEARDSEDTTIGMKDAPKLEIPIEIIGTQIQPQ